jgi:hypothetical protein
LRDSRRALSTSPGASRCHLHAVDGEHPELHEAHRPGEAEDLHEQLLELGEVLAAEGGDVS